jgi:hypothetical protein
MKTADQADTVADASTHLLENPYAPDFLHGRQFVVTLVLLAALAAVFLRGFSEAIGIAVVLVVVYLALNAVVVGDALVHLVTGSAKVSDWWSALTTEHSSALAVIGVALVAFPKLALGLSGFETGVLVMPQVAAGKGSAEEQLARRISGTRRLLATAAGIMAVLLLTSSFVTAVLIPAQEFQPGGAANGRALAYLAHLYLGNGFGTAYDISTIAILWFAGASAMAGLLNLVPRYLPRYGMAPAWALATRPLVLVFAAVAFLITWVFDANVDAQAGAYATGVLVLITSAAFAVTLSARRRRAHMTWAYALITLIFAVTTVANMVERPDGLKIAACFIASVLIVSLVSRVLRSYELRATGVSVADASEFEADLEIRGEERFGYQVLTVSSTAVANGIAAICLAMRDQFGLVPHVYFDWTEGSPLVHFLRFILWGSGEVAQVTREVLRRAEPNRSRRPHVHVG